MGFNKCNKKSRIIAKSLLILACISLISVILLVSKNITFYGLGQQFFRKGDYSNAIDYFSKIKSYKDSTSMINESYYYLGEKQLERKSYEDAIGSFKRTNYKNSKNLLDNAEYDLAISKMNSDCSESINLFKKLGNYKDSIAQLTVAQYNQACEYYISGNFKSAEAMFNQIKNYKDSSSYLSNINTLKKYQGTWTDFSTDEVIFNGWKITQIFTLGDASQRHDTTYQFDLDNNQAKCEYVFSGEYKTKYLGKDIFYINKDSLYWIIESNDPIEYTKISDSVDIPPQPSTSEIADAKSKDSLRGASPIIGMTTIEVENSSWGVPERKNTTITKYGTGEQWVYSNNRYIYFDNGLVTAIQE